MAILVIKIKRCEAQCKRKSRLYLVSAGEPRSLGKENAKEIRVPNILFNTIFFLHSHYKFYSWGKNEMKKITLDPPGELNVIKGSTVFRHGSVLIL